MSDGNCLEKDMPKMPQNAMRSSDTVIAGRRLGRRVFVREKEWAMKGPRRMKGIDRD